MPDPLASHLSFVKMGVWASRLGLEFMFLKKTSIGDRLLPSALHPWSA